MSDEKATTPAAGVTAKASTPPPDAQTDKAASPTPRDSHQASSPSSHPEPTNPAEPATPAQAEESKNKPAESADTEMKDASEPAAAAAAATAAAATHPSEEEAEQQAAPPKEEEKTGPAKEGGAATATPSSAKSRRKSTGASEPKGKKLNKKASKAKMVHLDAKPGDHFFVKLKGFPQWPAIICDEDMLPKALINSRPVTAARQDGSYREDYADGGKRVADRTYPVMYLQTNEFGWVPNTDLNDLNPETVMDVKMDKMRKDLQAAHRLASENHPLDHYKDLLQQYQEELIQRQKEKEAKAQSTPAKKSKKAKAPEVEEDEDVDMADADEPETKDKKAKKRKAEENAETPQRSSSVKKPKIKLTVNSTPKTSNGAGSTPKSTKSAQGGQTKSASKSKPKKSAAEGEDKKKSEKAATPKEPELSPEEKHERKGKEVLFLRHKLQRGLLTRDQEPKEDEMKGMSDFITKLEGFPDLEVSIIRSTKINKVLKAILKLDNIPKGDEFNFKTRSQALLEKWNKILAADGPSGEPAPGVNGTKSAAAGKGEAGTNGVKQKGHGGAKAESKTPDDLPAGAKDDAKASASEENAPEAVETSS